MAIASSSAIAIATASSSAIAIATASCSAIAIAAAGKRNGVVASDKPPTDRGRLAYYCAIPTTALGLMA